MVDDGILPEKWVYTRDWSAEEEDRYSQWIEINFTKDFLLKRKIWGDCADTEMIRRAWYSIKRGLPFGFRPTYDATRVVSLFDFKDRPMDFIAKMRNSVDTKNLPLNSYKIRIENGNASNLKPGIFNLYEGSHTQPIAEVNKRTGLMLIRASTLTTQPIELFESYYFMNVPDDHATLRHQFTPIVKDGKVSLELLNPNLEQVGPYGAGQVDFQKIAFFEWIQTIILKADISNISKIRRATLDVFSDDLLHLGQQRVKLVEEGYKVCRHYTGTDPLLCTPDHTGVHSTPSRDARLVELFWGYGSYLSIIKFQSHDEEVADYGESLLKSKSFEVTFNFERDDGHDITYTATYPLTELKRVFLGGFTSFDPRKSIQERWGEGIVNVRSSDPLRDYQTLRALLDGIKPSVASFGTRQNKLGLMKQTCTVPGWEHICKTETNQVSLDDFNLDVVVNKFISSTPNLSTDVKIDLNAFTIIQSSWRDERVLKMTYLPHLSVRDFLTAIVKQYHIEAYFMGGNEGGTVVIVHGGDATATPAPIPPITPINALMPDDTAARTEPYSFARWFHMRNYIDKSIEASAKNETVNTRPLTWQEEPAYRVYNLYDFTRALEKGAVTISPSASEKDLWGGDPIEIKIEKGI